MANRSPSGISMLSHGIVDPGVCDLVEAVQREDYRYDPWALIAQIYDIHNDRGVTLPANDFISSSSQWARSAGMQVGWHGRLLWQVWFV